ncbi:MAG: hypothetical protein QW412_00070 [Candidatus Aenigmatarchaeota archaeon]
MVRKVTQEQIEEIRKLHEDGISYFEISGRLAFQLQLYIIRDQKQRKGLGSIIRTLR